MSVSLNDMRDFVSGGLDDIPAGDDFGTVINLSELGDDLGASLLANTKVSPAPSAPKSVNFDLGGGGGGIEILEPLEATSLDINLDDPLAPRPSGHPSISISRDNTGADIFGSGGVPSGIPAAPANNSWNASIDDAPRSLSDPELERKEKSDMINKLQRLEQKGYPVSRRFTMNDALDEIKTEYNRLVDARQLETSIKFQRQMMMGLVTGVELLNEKFDPFDVQLKGWSESVHENIEDFDEVFEELYDKYKGKGSMPPEARLLMMLAGSGFMFHMSNSFFRSKMPSMNDIFSQNPGLQRQFAAAAAAQVGPGFGNFMNAAMPGTPGPEFYQSPPNPPTAPMAPTGMFYGSSRPEGQMPPQVPQGYAAQEPTKAPRREMKGPSGVDDILKTFEEARRQESEPMFNPFGSGTSPSGNVMMNGGPPGFSSGAADVQQPAVSAVSEIQSIVSEEIGSMAESRRGGGRRRKAQPVGNIMSMNI